MIAGLKGTVERRLPDSLLLSVGGVVYQVYTPASVIASAPEPGALCHLHTHLVVKDDLMALYGFAEPADVDVFRALLTVTGVGPKLALAMLSVIGMEGVVRALQREDPAVLAAVPGVGKRIGSRVVLELKGKLDSIPLPYSEGAGSDPLAQVVGALTGLGYSAAEAREAAQAMGVDSGADLAGAISAALRYLAEKQ